MIRRRRLPRPHLESSILRHAGWMGFNERKQMDKVQETKQFATHPGFCVHCGNPIYTGDAIVVYSGNKGKWGDLPDTAAHQECHESTEAK